MKALILAAGRGRRMGHLTSEQPKALLRVGGVTLLQRALDSLSAAGISDVAIVTGYQADKLSWPNFKKAFHNAEWETTNMVYSMAAAAEWLKDGETIVCYSDILFSAETIRSLMRSAGDIVVSNNLNWRTVWEQRFADPLSDAETFKRDASGCLTEIGLKPKSMTDIEGQYMGLFKINGAGWQSLKNFFSGLSPERFAKIDMTSTLNALILNGQKIQTVDVNEDWYEFDSEEDVRGFQGTGESL